MSPAAVESSSSGCGPVALPVFEALLLGGNSAITTVFLADGPSLSVCRKHPALSLVTALGVEVDLVRCERGPCSSLP